MKKLFLIGGMGAGKSTARKALVDEGLPYIDLDAVGHEVLKWDIVKEELRETFGDDVFDEDGEVVRRALAAKAFVSPYDTRALNRITLPRIEDAYTQIIDKLEQEDHEAVVVEYSVFKNREIGFMNNADVVIAILASSTRVSSAPSPRAGTRTTSAAASPARSPMPRASTRQTSCSTTTAPPKSCAMRSPSGGTTTRRAASSWGNRLRFRIHRGCRFGGPFVMPGVDGDRRMRARCGR